MSRKRSTPSTMAMAAGRHVEPRQDQPDRAAATRPAPRPCPSPSARTGPAPASCSPNDRSLPNAWARNMTVTPSNRAVPLWFIDRAERQHEPRHRRRHAQVVLGALDRRRQRGARRAGRERRHHRAADLAEERQRRHAAEEEHQQRQHHDEVEPRPPSTVSTNAPRARSSLYPNSAVVVKIRENTRIRRERHGQPDDEVGDLVDPFQQVDDGAALSGSMRVRASPTSTAVKMIASMSFSTNALSGFRGTTSTNVSMPNSASSPSSPWRLGVMGHEFVLLRRREAVAGADDVDEGQADGGRERGGDEEVRERLAGRPGRRSPDPPSRVTPRASDANTSGMMARKSRLRNTSPTGLAAYLTARATNSWRPGSPSAQALTAMPTTAPSARPRRMRP